MFGYSLSIAKRIITDLSEEDVKVKWRVDFNIFEFNKNENGAIIVIALGGLIILCIGYIIGGFIMKFHLSVKSIWFGYAVYLLYAVAIFVFSFFLKPKQEPKED